MTPAKYHDPTELAIDLGASDTLVVARHLLAYAASDRLIWRRKDHGILWFCAKKRTLSSTNATMTGTPYRNAKPQCLADVSRAKLRS